MKTVLERLPRGEVNGIKWVERGTARLTVRQGTTTLLLLRTADGDLIVQQTQAEIPDLGKWVHSRRRWLADRNVVAVDRIDVVI